jgi:TrmH family RNA methyltransferase
MVRLRDKRERDLTGHFLIEGYREIAAAVQGGVEFVAIYYCPVLYLGANEEELINSIKAPSYDVAADVFKKISYRDRPDGLIAIAHQMKKELKDLKKTDFLVIAQSIEKPGNLGTILRSADAAGADGVLIVDRCTDIYNPNVVRSSVGTLFAMPVVETTTAEALAFIKQKGIEVFAATPDAETSYRDIEYRKGVAVAVGTEQLGLTSEWMALKQVKIPMYGKANSLNVAMATTLLLYEVAYALRR